MDFGPGWEFYADRHQETLGPTTPDLGPLSRADLLGRLGQRLGEGRVHQQAVGQIRHPQPGGNGDGEHRDQLGGVPPTIEPPSTTPVAGSR